MARSGMKVTWRVQPDFMILHYFIAYTLNNIPSYIITRQFFVYINDCLCLNLLSLINKEINILVNN